MVLDRQEYKLLACIFSFMLCTCSSTPGNTRPSRRPVPPSSEELRAINELTSRNQRIARCRELEATIESMRVYCTDYRAQANIGNAEYRVEATCRAIEEFDTRCKETLANDNER